MMVEFDFGSGREPPRYRVDMIRTALTQLDKAARLKGFLPVTVGLSVAADETLTFYAQGERAEQACQISLGASRLLPSVRS